MKVLCLSGERRVAYLIKHVLQFEGYGVTLGRSVAEAFERLDENPGLVVAAAPLEDADVEQVAATLRRAGLAAPLIIVDPQLDPATLVARIRQALASSEPPASPRAGTGRARPTLPGV